MPPDPLITETALDEVARRLRFLGYDVETLPGARLEQLFASARDLGLTVLTTSRRHPRRFAGVRSLVVPAGDVGAAVRTVALACAPAGPPFSRCPRCNMGLMDADPSAPGDPVPPGIRASGRPLRRCPRCNRWFWHGSHVDRIREWLEATLGQPIPPPGEPGTLVLPLRGGAPGPSAGAS